MNTYPIWMYLFAPAAWIAILPWKFLLVTIALLACNRSYELSREKPFYKKNVLWSWLIVLLGDLAGTLLLLLVQAYFTEGIYEFLAYPVAFNPYDNIYSVLYVYAVFALVIFLMRYALCNWLFPRSIADKAMRKRVALVVAVFCAPWLFLIPSQLFYTPENVHYFTNHAIWRAYTEAAPEGDSQALDEDALLALREAANYGRKLGDAGAGTVSGSEADGVWVLSSEYMTEDLEVRLWYTGREKAVLCVGEKWYEATVAETRSLVDALENTEGTEAE